MTGPKAPVKRVSYCTIVVALATISRTASKTSRSLICWSSSLSFWIFASLGCCAMYTEIAASIRMSEVRRPWCAAMRVPFTGTSILICGWGCE